jgi:hypothetical protein
MKPTPRVTGSTPVKGTPRAVRTPRVVAKGSPTPKVVARPRVVASSKTNRIVFWIPVVLTIGVGAFLVAPYLQKPAEQGPTEAEIRLAAQAPALPAVSPNVAASGSVPTSESETTAAPSPEVDGAARVNARLEVVRLFESVQDFISRREFTAAADEIAAWIATHEQHPARADAERYRNRLDAAAKVVSALVNDRQLLTGTQVSMGSAKWSVWKITPEDIGFRVQSQFGTVERALPYSSIGEPAFLQLLTALDRKNPAGALAATYLLGVGKPAQAKALLAEGPADAKARFGPEIEDAEKLATDIALVSRLARIESFVARGELASADSQIHECLVAIPQHEFLTVAYAPKIAAWRAQLASANGGKPAVSQNATAMDGLRLSVSGTVPVGDPERQQLLAATKAATAKGDWAGHLTALNAAIANAAGAGGWSLQARNLVRLLELPTPTLAIEQARFIRAVGAPTLTTFGNEASNRDFLAWLMVRPSILAAFNDTVQRQDKVGDALQQWRVIWNDDPDNREKLANLAIACALVFDEPVRINPAIYGEVDQSQSGSSTRSSAGPTEASALARYRFFRDSEKKGSLKAPLDQLTPGELVWVVDAPVPDSELVWAQKYVNFSRRDWGRAYGHIRYRMDRATQGVNPYKAYTLSEIEKEGGICGDQAYFAAISAKANGIPAMVIGGVGDRGGHAWFGYYIGRNQWNLDTGRYADNYAAGTTNHPQTGASIKEHELRQFTDPARRTADFRQSERLVELASLLRDAGQPDLSTLSYELALRSAPKNITAWNAKLDALAAAKVPAEEWLRESARMRTTFREFSDLVQEIDKREANYVASNADAATARKLVRRQTARMQRTDSQRSDLILDSFFREAEIATKAGDKEGVGRIYRDALRDKGSEVVSFEKIAGRYYGWGKDNGKAADVTKELVAFFDRKHDQPTGDVFAMGAYRGVLKMLTSMAEEQQLAPLQNRLVRREARLKELEDRLGKSQSQGADR